MLNIYNNDLFEVENTPKIINKDSYLILKTTICKIKSILLNFYGNDDLSYEPTKYQRLNIITRGIISEELETPILNWTIVVDEEYNKILEIENICKSTKVILQLINLTNIINTSFEIIIYCNCNILNSTNNKKYRLENILEYDSENFVNNIRIYNMTKNVLDESGFIKTFELDCYKDMLYVELIKNFYPYGLKNYENSNIIRHNLVEYLNTISKNKKLKDIIHSNKHSETKIKNIFYYIISIFVINTSYKSSICQVFDNNLKDVLEVECDYSIINKVAEKTLIANNNDLR